MDSMNNILTISKRSTIPLQYRSPVHHQMIQVLFYIDQAIFLHELIISFFKVLQWSGSKCYNVRLVGKIVQELVATS